MAQPKDDYGTKPSDRSDAEWNVREAELREQDRAEGKDPEKQSPPDPDPWALPTITDWD